MKICKTMAAALASVILLTGCSNTNNTQTTDAPDVTAIDTATKEIRQNDFRGGVMRTYALQNNVLAIMESMKRNNIVVREDNPNSYWTTSGYQDFVSTFLTTPIINSTQWFNEEQTTWDELVAQMFSVPNSFTVPGDEGAYKAKSGVSAVRNEKDDYTVTGMSENIDTMNGTSTYKVLYDCDKDWCKAFTDVYIPGAGVSGVTGQLYEYARISNNVFAVQTGTERLLVVLEDAADADIRERPIKEFYYSKLSGGQRTTFKQYEPLPEENEAGSKIVENIQLNNLRAKYPLLNENGEVATQYGVSNSIFLQDNVSGTDYKWVFEDGALQQAIVFKENTLVVTTFNKLSEKYERFIYSVEKVNESLVSEIEAMVNIEGLVGVVSVSTTETQADSPADTSEAAAIGGQLSDLITSIVEDSLSISTEETSAQNDSSPSAPESYPEPSTSAAEPQSSYEASSTSEIRGE